VTGREVEKRPWPSAVLWLFFLASFFFASYGFATWLSARRPNVPSIVFRWEATIPFLAWTIVPYWSTDLLYAASLFTCRTKHELNTHAKRLIAVQTLSVAVFLICPLRFSFERPVVVGAFAPMFDSLMTFDKPFNQAPSLHLGIGAILWVRYAAHLTGFRRMLMQLWMIAVGISTLTTFQHHFIDLPTGVLTGLLAIALFPMTPNRARRLSAAYFTGASFLFILALRFGGAAWLLLWPLCALLVPGAAYAIGRPELFCKKRLVMTLLLAPYLAGAWLNSRFRRSPAVQHVASDVWIGRAAGRSAYSDDGFHSAVDVTAEFPARMRGIHYRSIPMLDLIPPTPEQLRRAVQAIEDLTQARPTVVFCALGYSRSAAVVATWLATTGRTRSVAAAIETVRRERPCVALDDAHKAAMEEALNGA
jgi:hypothetical protein